MPPPVSYQRFSLFLILFAPRHPRLSRPLPSSPPPRALVRALFSSPAALSLLTRYSSYVIAYLTLFHRIFAYSHIAPRTSSSFSQSYFLSRSRPGNLVPPLFRVLLAQNGNAYAGKRARSSSYFLVFHSRLSLTFPQDVNCPPPSFYRFPPAVRFAFSPPSLPIPHFVLPLLHSHSQYLSIFCPRLLFFPHSDRCDAFSLHVYASCYERHP